MLVCSRCGTEVVVAGHPCPSCGHRGAVEARFYAGEVKPAPASAEAAPAVMASRSGALPDEQRAWSPWLGAVLAIVLTPPAGGFVAARNLQRLAGGKIDPWLTALYLLVGELIAAAVAGWIARGNLALCWLPLAVYAIAVAAWLVLWQWQPVKQRRSEVPGRHAPGVDAFGAFVLALVFSAVTSLAVYQVADRVGQQALSRPLAEWRAKQKSDLPPMDMGFPPM